MELIPRSISSTLILQIEAVHCQMIMQPPPNHYQQVASEMLKYLIKQHFFARVLENNLHISAYDRLNILR